MVDSKDAPEFQKFLIDFGFKLRYSTANKVYPGMEDYLGFGEDYGIIYHLHVHYKLVIGKKNQKNYRLPIEELILNTSLWDDKYPIKIIKPELEWIILIFQIKLIEIQSIFMLRHYFLNY
ncbi:MAG: hypothetical protein ACTSPQ_21420 [Candidatus Helarchaeota archaeon]